MNTGVIGGIPYKDTTYKVRVVHFKDFIADSMKRNEMKDIALSVYRNMLTLATLVSHHHLDKVVRLSVVDADLIVVGEPVYTSKEQGRLNDYVVIVGRTDEGVQVHTVWRYACVDGIYYLVKQQIS